MWRPLLRVNRPPEDPPRQSHCGKYSSERWLVVKHWSPKTPFMSRIPSSASPRGYIISLLPRSRQLTFVNCSRNFPLAAGTQAPVHLANTSRKIGAWKRTAAGSEAAEIVVSVPWLALALTREETTGIYSTAQHKGLRKLNTQRTVARASLGDQKLFQAMMHRSRLSLTRFQSPALEIELGAYRITAPALARLGGRDTFFAGWASLSARICT